MSSPEQTMHCPTDETLAAFIDGRLEGEALERVAEHVASCSECYATWQAGSEFRDLDASLKPLVLPFRRRYAVALAATFAAAATVAIIFLSPLRDRFFRPEHPAAPLVAAADLLEERPIEGRLAGGFAYKELKRTMRSVGDDSGDDGAKWKLESVVSEMAERVKRDPSPRNLHSYGSALLLVGKREESIQNLERALTTSTGEDDPIRAIRLSNDVDLLTDLGAAYIARARQERSDQDAINAVEAAERAWTLAKTPETAWNRALAIHYSHFKAHAVKAWNDYLELDPSSPWAGEARKKIAELTANTSNAPWEKLREELRAAALRGDRTAVAAIVDAEPEKARVYGEGDLLDLAALSDQPDERRIAAAIARAIEDRSGEALLFDTLEHLRSSDAESAAAIAKGVVDYRAGRDLMRTGKHAEAHPKFLEAYARLNERGSPFAFRAAVYAATTQHYLGKNEEAIAFLDAQLRRIDRVRYPLAAGQMLWTRGLAQLVLGRPETALRSHTEAAGLIARVRESASLAGVELVVADDLRYMGDLRGSWQHHFRAIEALDATVPRDRAHNVLNGAVRAALGQGYVYYPALVHASVLESAREATNPLILVDALLTRSRLAVTLRDFAGARTAVAEAEKVWPTAAESAVKTRIRADIEAARHRVAEAAGERSSPAALAQSIALVRGVEHTRLAELHLMRARALLRDGARAEAEVDLRSGLQELEQQRRDLMTDDAKRMFTSVGEGLVSEAVRLAVERNDAVAAFDIVEAARSRALLDAFMAASAPGPSGPLSWNEMRSLLPERTAVISYFILPDQLVVWIARRDDLRMARWPINAVTLRKATRGDFANARLETLYDLLFRRVEESVRDAEALVMVPDSALTSVPFAALRDRTSGRYLIENSSVALSMSVNLLVQATRRETPARSGRALIVSAPAPAGDRLPRLHAAAEEASLAAHRFPDVVFLAEGDATADAFRRRALEAELIHFAGHAVANRVRPALSALLFQGPSDEAEMLTVKEIAALQLARTRLVVLAACETAAGTVATEPPLTIATAFMAAGASSVLASLRPADDSFSAELMREFYDELLRGRSVADALRVAQIRLIRGGKATPRDWAIFSVIGNPGPYVSPTRHKRV